jgi:hypothetical protein
MRRISGTPSILAEPNSNLKYLITNWVSTVKIRVTGLAEPIVF